MLRYTSSGRWTHTPLSLSCYANNGGPYTFVTLIYPDSYIGDEGTVPHLPSHVVHRTYPAGARAGHVCNAPQERVTGRLQESGIRNQEMFICPKNT